MRYLFLGLALILAPAAAWGNDLFDHFTVGELITLYEAGELSETEQKQVRQRLAPFLQIGEDGDLSMEDSAPTGFADIPRSERQQLHLPSNGDRRAMGESHEEGPGVSRVSHDFSQEQDRPPGSSDSSRGSRGYFRGDRLYGKESGGYLEDRLEGGRPDSKTYRREQDSRQSAWYVMLIVEDEDRLEQGVRFFHAHDYEDARAVSRGGQHAIVLGQFERERRARALQRQIKDRTGFEPHVRSNRRR